MTRNAGIILIFLFIQASLSAQQPHYSVKNLQHSNDGSFNNTTPPHKEGKVVSYVQAKVTLWDIDNDNKYFVAINDRLLICFEGYWKNGQKDGPVTAYVIDSLDHSRRFKIYQQEYKNDKLNGQWRQFTLRGTLHSYRTFRNDSLRSIARQYDVDGKKILTEREYLSANEYIEHEFYPSGDVERTITIKNGKKNGVARHFTPAGEKIEEVEFKNDEFDGPWKYFHPNGQLWMEMIYKRGLQWEVIANYAADGKRRDAGTLKNGNGTVIYYNDDNSVREQLTFKNGKQQ